MSIQQYWNRSGMLYPDPEDTSTFMAWRDPVVTYADHVAAIAACEARVERIAGLATWAHIEGENMPTDAASLAEAVGALGFDLGRHRGYQRGLDAARDAVEALPDWMGQKATSGSRIHRSAALAAIDALKGEQP